MGYEDSWVSVGVGAAHASEQLAHECTSCERTPVSKGWNKDSLESKPSVIF